MYLKSCFSAQIGSVIFFPINVILDVEGGAEVQSESVIMIERCGGGMFCF